MEPDEQEEEFFDEFDEGEDEYEIDESIDEEDEDSEQGEEEEEESEGGEEAVEEWQAHSTFPEATWRHVQARLQSLAADGMRDLTVVLIGKPGSGCSSTANALLGAPAHDVQPVTAHAVAGSGCVKVTSVGHEGFTMRVIDVRDAVVGNQVNLVALKQLSSELGEQRVDAVLLVDRMDVFHVDGIDQQLYRAISSHFGRDVWKRTLLCLTRGGLTPPRGYTYEQLLAKRAAQVNAAARAAGAPPNLPVAAVENNSRCTLRDGERVLPDGTVWLSSLFDHLEDLKRRGPGAITMHFKPHNPNRKRLWLIPALLAAQAAFYVCVLDRIMEDDGLRGDRSGEYDPETIREQRLLRETRRQLSKNEAKAKRRQAAHSRSRALDAREQLSAQGRSSGYKSIQYMDDDDDDDDEDDD